MNESIDELLNNYHITLDDLKLENRHITDFSNIAPGTKLRITPITSEINQILEVSEPLVLYNDNDPTLLGLGDINEIKEEKSKNNNDIKRGIKYVYPPRYNRYRR